MRNDRPESDPRLGLVRQLVELIKLLIILLGFQD